MLITSVQLRQLALPLIENLGAAHGVIDTRPTILVAVESDGLIGWGECVALAEPGYLDEWSDGEYDVLRQNLASRLVAAPDVSAANVSALLADIAGHRTSKAAIEMALIDLELRRDGKSLATAIGATKKAVDCCIVIGLRSIESVIASVANRSNEGYGTFKLKIKPGDDVERVAAVRDAFPEVVLRVDANGSYDWTDRSDRKALAALAKSDVALIEQPLSPSQDSYMKELRESLSTPVTLDESIVSMTTALDVVAKGIADVMTVKPGPVGGLAAAVAIHDACGALGIPLSLGGMVDGGLSRAANLAVAAMPGFAGQAAEVSPDGRWFSESFLTSSVVAIDGRIAVPQTVGIGADVSMEVVDRITLRGVTLNRR